MCNLSERQYNTIMLHDDGMKNKISKLILGLGVIH